MTSVTSKTLLKFLALALLTGFVIYYLYLKPEHFVVTTTKPKTVAACPTIAPPPVGSIISKFSGVGINVTSVLPSTSTGNQKLYIIESIPVSSSDVLGGVYSITDDNLLTIVVKNTNDINQLWTLTQIKDATGATCFVVMPYLQKVKGIQFALQYENGNLSFRPYSKTYQAQHWLTSTTRFNKGIPILNYNPVSIYTAEFNPNGNSGSISTLSNLDDENTQKVNDVVNLIKQSVQQYMTQLSASTSGTNNVSASSFGNKVNPLNVNIMLKNNGKSAFTDVDAAVPAPSESNSVLALLDKYEAATNPIDKSSFTLYRKSDLESSIQDALPITSMGLDNYVPNRIGSCNCKI
jgi:hypothetical protein